MDEHAIIKDYPYETDTEELTIMTDILQHSGSDPATRKEIEDEQEAWRSYYALFEDERKKLQEALEEKDQKIEEKNQKIEEKDQKIEEKDQELEKQRKLIEELTRKLRRE